MTDEALDRLEELVRDLSEQRAELEAAIERGRGVADAIRSAARAANEAASMISMEASRLRR